VEQPDGHVAFWTQRDAWAPPGVNRWFETAGTKSVDVAPFP
jgi:hypothetical protein